MNDKKPEMKTISPIIPVELIQRLRDYTARTGRKQTWVVEQALKEWLDREEAKNN